MWCWKCWRFRGFFRRGIAMRLSKDHPEVFIVKIEIRCSECGAIKRTDYVGAPMSPEPYIKEASNHG